LDSLDELNVKPSTVQNAVFPWHSMRSIQQMVLIWNFHPYGKTKSDDSTAFSDDLNGCRYQAINWLRNLLISAR